MTEIKKATKQRKWALLLSLFVYNMHLETIGDEITKKDRRDRLWPREFEWWNCQMRKGVNRKKAIFLCFQRREPDFNPPLNVFPFQRLHSLCVYSFFFLFVLSFLRFIYYFYGYIVLTVTSIQGRPGSRRLHTILDAAICSRQNYLW